MASQGAPEMPKWLPKVLPRCSKGSPKGARWVLKMATQEMPKRRHRTVQKASEQKNHDMLRWFLEALKSKIRIKSSVQVLNW